MPWEQQHAGGYALSLGALPTRSQKKHSTVRSFGGGGLLYARRRPVSVLEFGGFHWTSEASRHPAPELLGVATRITAAMKSRFLAIRIRPRYRDIPLNDDRTLPEAFDAG